MNTITPNMIKLELVHKETVFRYLQTQCSISGQGLGFTTQLVHASCGPNEGEYVEDRADTHYTSFIVLEDHRVEAVVKDLQQVARHEKLFITTTPVTVYKMSGK
jgi:hypothetical protein